MTLITRSDDERINLAVDSGNWILLENSLRAALAVRDTLAGQLCRAVNLIRRGYCSTVTEDDLKGVLPDTAIPCPHEEEAKRLDLAARNSHVYHRCDHNNPCELCIELRRRADAGREGEMNNCTVCGFVGSLPDKHLEFTHSAINAQWDEIRKRDTIVRALRDIIKEQKKSQLILELRRENGGLRAELSIAKRAVREMDERLQAR